MTGERPLTSADQPPRRESGDVRSYIHRPPRVTPTVHRDRPPRIVHRELFYSFLYLREKICHLFLLCLCVFHRSARAYRARIFPSSYYNSGKYNRPFFFLYRLYFFFIIIINGRESTCICSAFGWACHPDAVSRMP